MDMITPTIKLFTSKNDNNTGIHILIINTSSGTMGLNAFMTPEPDPINSVYLHNSKEIRDTWATSRRE